MEQADLDARRNRVYSQAEQNNVLPRKTLMLRSTSNVIDIADVDKNLDTQAANNAGENNR